VKNELIYMDTLNARVCSSGTWDEALQWLRRENPAGTTGNWVKKEQENCAPVKCANNSEMTHYMFTC
jgi:hypothetical protein